jgi:hypothetical protein
MGSYSRLRWPEIEPSRRKGPVCSLAQGHLGRRGTGGIRACHSVAMRVNGTEMYLRRFMIYAPATMPASAHEQGGLAVARHTELLQESPPRLLFSDTQPSGSVCGPIAIHIFGLELSVPMQSVY